MHCGASAGHTQYSYVFYALAHIVPVQLFSLPLHYFYFVLVFVCFFLLHFFVSCEVVGVVGGAMGYWYAELMLNFHTRLILYLFILSLRNMFSCNGQSLLALLHNSYTLCELITDMRNCDIQCNLIHLLCRSDRKSRAVGILIKITKSHRNWLSTGKCAYIFFYSINILLWSLPWPPSLLSDPEIPAYVLFIWKMSSRRILCCWSYANSVHTQPSRSSIPTLYQQSTQKHLFKMKYSHHALVSQSAICSAIPCSSQSNCMRSRAQII